MRKIFYDYCCPSLENTPSSAVIDTSVVDWHSIQPAPVGLVAPPTNPNPNPKLVYTPEHYKAKTFFRLKPQEWAVIVFDGANLDGLRSDLIYKVVPGWPRMELEMSRHYLGILVQNSSQTTHVFVHRNTRLNHLLHMDHIVSCFTLVSAEEWLKAQQVYWGEASQEVDDDDEVTSSSSTL